MKINLLLCALFQANGLDERFNQTLQNMSAKLVHSNKDWWENYLDACVYAYNTFKCESFRSSPFNIMFGRLTVLLIDLQTHCKDEKTFVVERNDADIEEHLKDQRKILVTAKTNFLAAQKRQKDQYECKHSNSRMVLLF